MKKEFETHEGGCSCGHVRYKVKSDPLIVHCCHCTWCQRQSGAAFAINALIEADCVELLSGDVEVIDTPSPSGAGQDIARCPKCKVAVWSNYEFGGLRERVRFIRVGSLDDPNRLPPDVHIFTTTKQPWIILPKDDYAVDEFYDSSKTWSIGSLKRRKSLMKAFAADNRELESAN